MTETRMEHRKHMWVRMSRGNWEMVSSDVADALIANGSASIPTLNADKSRAEIASLLRELADTIEADTKSVVDCNVEYGIERWPGTNQWTECCYNGFQSWRFELYLPSTDYRTPEQRATRKE